MKDYKMPENLRQLMKERNITTGALCRITGISRPSIRDWTNRRRMPNVYSVMILADFFNVSLDELIYGDKHD